MAVVRPDGYVCQLNAAAESLLGISANQAHERHLPSLQPELAPLAPLRPGAPATLEKRARAVDSVAAMAAGGFEEAVVLPNSFRSAWLPARAGIPRRFGYRGDLRGPLLAPALPRPRGRRPQVEDYRELLAAMGVAPPADWAPRLALPADLREAGRERLARAPQAFHSWLAEANTHYEVIASFLALLELIKQQAVHTRQSGPFADIWLEPLPPGS